MERTRTAVSAVVVGVVLLVVAIASAYTAAVDRSSVAVPVAATAPPPADRLTASIEAAQRRLDEVPKDHATWAALGAAYVEQARLTADPSYYEKAEGALAESLRLRPERNDAALTGLGALANARHDFRAAADFAEQALAVNAYSATAWGVLTDARTQLGDYSGATEALDRMLELRPGIASFTRASYDAELHGDHETAVSALEQALDIATTPADKAFCRTYLGQLAWSAGDLEEAERQFAAGAESAPDDPALRLGLARVAAAKGDVERATREYRRVVQSQPLPEHLVEYGEFLLSIGEEEQAADQFAVFETVRRLFDANGVADDLGVALFEADHGDPRAAVAAARAEFDRRQNIDAHDALAWALHKAGRDAEAIEHARAATALGGSNALFLYHRGVIEAALGLDDDARSTLTDALRNPHFSALHAPRAAELLTSLGGRP
jgi:tetratricopeptide (TPR) repeat protein